MKNVFLEFNLEEHNAREITIDDVVFPCPKHIIYWVNCDLNNRELFDKVKNAFKFPQELIELCDSKSKSPTLLNEDESISLNIQYPPITDLMSKDFSLESFIIHLSNQFCFTASYSELPASEDFLCNHKKYVRYAKTPCFILFLMLDNTVNDYAKLLFNYEILMDDLEDKVQDFENNTNIYQEVMGIKQQVMKIKRNIISIREILMRISGRNISVISEQCGQSLKNLANHTHLEINEADSVREFLNSLLGQIDNALMQKMNHTMKVLTAFAAIFLPLTLITGIYGMNFDWIPELHWKYGYFYAILLLVFCAFLMLWVFKKKKWF